VLPLVLLVIGIAGAGAIRTRAAAAQVGRV
jgi:hypothetical protein